MADDGESLGLEDETVGLMMKDEQRVPFCSLDFSLQGEQIRNHLPDDIVFFILSYLPLKPLKRFTCVCKLWARLFENPHFMKIFVNNFFISNWSYNYQDTSLLLCRIVPGYIQCGFNSSLFSLSNESFQNRLKLEWPNPFQEDDPSFSIMGSTSVNGILCLYQLHRQTMSVVLWNPTTEESKVIPPSPVDSVPPNQEANFDLIGFGYDRVRDDYNVIRCACFFPVEQGFLPDGEEVPDGPELQDHLWEIYSLRSNSWRTLDVDDSDLPCCLDHINRLYLDGMCHWIGHVDDIDTLNFDTYLVSFDLSNEVFYTTGMPLDMPSSEDPVRYLLLLNESVAVITNPRDTPDFYISILAQVGVKESWIKLFILESLPCVDRPIGTGKKGNIFFVKKDDELIQFDLSTHMIEELGVKVAKDKSKIVLYKESFLPIGEISN